MPVRTFPLARRLVAEALGTAALVTAVIGSGVMADSLSGGNDALALLGNTLSTGAALMVLILVLGPVSGAHINPAVSLVFALRGELAFGELVLYAGVQFIGGVAGAVVAHAMFDLPVVSFFVDSRTGTAQWLSELVATFGLVGTILGTLYARPSAVAYTVGLYITAAYWFTGSTSFANPAVALGRAFTDTFSGIRLVDLPGFFAAEFAGAAAALVFFGWLFRPGLAQAPSSEPSAPGRQSS